MPFTPSHAVAILPFARTPLAPAALALGSMAPDLPYFLPLGISRDFSHSLEGAPTIDLAVGLVAFLLWLTLLRAPVIDYAPAWVRERMPPRAKWRARGLLVSGLLVLAALELGILSHLLLDELTHEGGWLDTIAPWTNEDVGPIAVANLVHAGFSLAATLIIAWWVSGWARRTPRVPRDSRVGARERVATWVVLSVVFVGVGLYWCLNNIARGRNELDFQLVFIAFCIAVAVAGAIALVLAVVWWTRPYRERITATTLPSTSA